MKKFIYLMMLLLVGLTFFSSCKDDEKEEPAINPEDTITVPPPTTADSLQGVWYSYAATIQGPSNTYTLTTTDFVILGYDTLKFDGTNVSHIWDATTPSGNWPPKLLTGTFGASNGVLTNAITSQTIWGGIGWGIPNTNLVNDTYLYDISFATTPSAAPYTKDTLTLVMEGNTVITANYYNPTIDVYLLNPGTSSSDNPTLTINFKRVQ